MWRAFLYALIACLLVSCSGSGQRRSSNSESRIPVTTESYEKIRKSFESQAERGQITWKEAAIRTRDLDKDFYARAGFFSSWKYDSDDEEFHAFCIALAERVDRKLMTVSEYDAARIARMNALNARSQMLNASQPIQNSSSGVVCTLSRQWSSGMNKNCVYNCLGSEAVKTIGAAEICPISTRQ